MEYVEGLPLTTYCDQNQLDVMARLQLLKKVCDAVQAAHQMLIVHRDLKPSNILVTQEGRPKLLDFGIAKLLEPAALGLDGETTAGWSRPLTPKYASPEQLAGEPVSAASDVYSLGVLLYELLCGETPWNWKRSSRRDALSTLAATIPSPPSARLRQPGAAAIARLRGTSPAALERTLRPDLDAVALAC